MTKLDTQNEFIARHIGPRDADTAAMLQLLGYDSVDALTNAVIPESIKGTSILGEQPGLSEADALAKIKAIAAKNQQFKNYIGQGYYGTHTPSPILRNLLENPAWYTAYTPYQPEISQGRLEALLNFQTLSSDLSGLPIATYIHAGWLREAVCMHMCPYARFQSVMFDKDTLTISYDFARGEHRGPRKRDVAPAAVGLGDCIDCQLCVQVCPTGIDIRDGLQMECIGCAACIDACDSIMDKMGYAPGLISYTSEHELQGGKTRLLRPRLIGYTAVLLAMIGALALALVERPMVSLDVSKDRGLFRENSQGQIENIYSLKVINKTQEHQDYRLMLVEGDDFQLQGKTELSLAPGEIVDVPVSVAMTTQRPSSSSQSIVFKIVDTDEPGIYSEAKSRFVAPMNR